MSRSLNINVINNNSDALSMSQSTVDWCNNEKQTTRIKKKVLRSKMHRSVSDNVQLSTTNTCKNSFSRLIKQNLTQETSNKKSSINCKVQIKKQYSKLNSSFNINEKNHQRRSSIESSHSSSSVNTIHEIGDAYYEWDDYKVCINIKLF